MKPPRLLIIAGSDSGGGAGIQADIKTASAFGVYAMTAITAVTAQNTHGVHAIHAIPAELVRDQIVHCLKDIGADAIKIGMLGPVDVIESVADVLGLEAKSIPLVLDPVMVAKGGAPLLAADSVRALKRLLLPFATLVTPNIPEAVALTGITPDSEDKARAAADRLFACGAGAVLFKGGHGDGAMVRDILIEANNEMLVLESPRKDTAHTHGTGCTLASAIACELARGKQLTAAVSNAHAYVQAAIESAPGLGGGHGPLNHFVSPEF